MQIVESRGTKAICHYRGETSLVDTAQIGEQNAGTWLLVFLNCAREVISAEKAGQINQTLQDMRLTMQNQVGFSELFADLPDR